MKNAGAIFSTRHLVAHTISFFFAYSLVKLLGECGVVQNDEFTLEEYWPTDNVDCGEERRKKMRVNYYIEGTNEEQYKNNGSY